MPSPFKTFNLTETPLEGTNLIEASAGTGKTYAIAGLFLRLILEKGLSVNRILVVTFTVAAAQELRARIRSRLREALSALENPGLMTDDPLLIKTRELAADDSTAAERLTGALREFDTAGIFTIHGFCLDLLQSHAFGSGSLFTTALSDGTQGWLEETGADYWREIFYNSESSAAPYLYRAGVRPSTFVEIIKKRGIGPARITPPASKADTLPLISSADKMKRAFAEASDCWNKNRSSITALYGVSIRGASFKSNHMPGRFRDLESYFSEGIPENTFKQLIYFSAELIREKCGDEPASDPFFHKMDLLLNAADEFTAALNQLKVSHLVNSIEYSEKAMAEKMRARDSRDFNSLITDAAAALNSPAGPALAHALRSDYRAALIDEFQDTDPLQYEIFRKIFHHPSALLFLIGDPKQAIYGFRDADIFSYIEASRRAENRYTLKTNYRSRPGLVASINSLFSRPGNPFLFQEIAFEAAAVPEKSSSSLFTIDGIEPTNLTLGLIDPTGIASRDGSVTGALASDISEKWTAAEISRLLDAGLRGSALIAGKPLMPGDIAVIVRKNRQASSMKERLREYSIPSVIYSAGSVLESEAAADASLLMRGISGFRDLRLMKGALVTRIFGYYSDGIIALNTDDSLREKLLASFMEYREIWTSSGFMTMLHILLAREEARGRLLSSIDGERYLTDLLHTAELLHGAENKEGLGIEALIDYLEDKRGGGASADENQLRLESDDNAVKIVTVHKSKGLEYPLVFCPYLWDSVNIKDPYPFKYHDPDSGDTVFTVDGGDDAEREIAVKQREDLAENMRLMYVALTRARHACWFTWGKINKKQGTAPAVIFHSEEKDDISEGPAALTNRVESLSWDKMVTDITGACRAAEVSLVTASPEGGLLYQAKAAPQKDPMSREFTAGRIRQWSVASYSRITASKEASGEIETFTVTAPAEKSDEKNRFTFPAGAEAGSCMHKIFETAPYSSENKNDLDSLILSSLGEYGFDPVWKDTLAEIFHSTIKAHLPAPDGKPFSLAETDPSMRINELQFYFPCGEISARGLASVFSSAAGPMDSAEQLKKLGFSMTGGYMTGFIDLVIRHQSRYYILDWKSNRLGYSFSDYSPERLKEAMAHSLYDLQYHIYVMALNRLLEKTDSAYSYEKNFGGVLYPFLRGTEAGSGGGIFADLPDKKLIHDLDRYFREGDAG